MTIVAWVEILGTSLVHGHLSNLPRRISTFWIMPQRSEWQWNELIHIWSFYWTQICDNDLGTTMGYYPDFTSPIENDIFGSNDSLIVRHFVDSLFTGSTGLRACERAGYVAQWSGEANPSLFTGLPPRLDGHSLAQLTLRAHHRQLTPPSHRRRPSSLSPTQTLPHHHFWLSFSSYQRHLDQDGF